MYKIKLFHGSEYVIKKPVLSLGKITNDYGQGFYCTTDMEMAKEWSCKNNTYRIVNEYELEIGELKILDLFDGKYNVLHWIALLLKNRIFSVQEEIAILSIKYLLEKYFIDTSQYDVIIGYRADNSFFSYAQSFISNSLSVNNLEKAMKLGRLGAQIVLISEKAFSKLEFKTAKMVDKKIYYNKYIVRDLQARCDYKDEIKNSKLHMEDIYIMDIIRKENQK